MKQLIAGMTHYESSPARCERCENMLGKTDFMAEVAHLNLVSKDFLAGLLKMLRFCKGILFYRVAKNNYPIG
jgi:hypothetical protein